RRPADQSGDVSPCDLGAVETIREAFGGHCRLRYTRILKSPASTAEFLAEQYRDFLKKESRYPVCADEVRTYISELTAQWAGFELIYYELCKDETEFIAEAFQSPEVIVTVSVCGCVEPRAVTWEAREWLHRQIVEQTSTPDSLPSPALFMRN